MAVSDWTSLTLLNALVGFASRDPAWPTPFTDCGWRVSIIEPDWLVDVPERKQPAKIKPDLVLAFKGGAKLLLLECKAGTVQQDQLQRYLLVTPEAIAPQSNEPDVDETQVVYVGLEQHRASTLTSLAPTAVPLIVFSESEATLVHAVLLETCINAVFTAGVPLKGRVPTSYLPLTDDSPLNESVPVVMRALMQFALAGKRQFDCRDVAEQIFDGMYEHLARGYRKAIEGPIDKALRELAKRRLLGDVLEARNGLWSMKPEFGSSGGLQFTTATRRIQEEMERLTQQQPLDLN